MRVWNRPAGALLERFGVFDEATANKLRAEGAGAYSDVAESTLESIQSPPVVIHRR